MLENGEIKFFENKPDEQQMMDDYISYRIRKENEEYESLLKEMNDNMMYEDNTSPNIIRKLKLYNKIDYVNYAREILTDKVFPEWLYNEIVIIDKKTGNVEINESNLHTQLYKTDKNHIYTLLPLDLINV